jgi:hypothetical protein
MSFANERTVAALFDGVETLERAVLAASTFKVGDRVLIEGFARGEIRCVFITTTGKTRYVVEYRIGDIGEYLHICAEDTLRSAP